MAKMGSEDSLTFHDMECVNFYEIIYLKLTAPHKLS